MKNDDGEVQLEDPTEESKTDKDENNDLNLEPVPKRDYSLMDTLS